MYVSEYLKLFSVMHKTEEKNCCPSVRSKLCFSLVRLCNLSFFFAMLPSCLFGLHHLYSHILQKLDIVKNLWPVIFANVVIASLQQSHTALNILSEIEVGRHIACSSIISVFDSSSFTKAHLYLSGGVSHCVQFVVVPMAHTLSTYFCATTLRCYESLLQWSCL